jgi:hypothetical protein
MADIDYETRYYYDRNSISNKFFTLNQDLIEYFSRFSDPEYWEFLKNLNNLKDDFTALMYEVKQIQGNWKFKDQVLPPLFGEAKHTLDKIIEEFYKLYGNDLNTITKDTYEFDEFSETRRQFRLLKYLIRKFDELFLDPRDLSSFFTHRRLESAIMRMDKRITNNLLLSIHDKYLNICKRIGKKGLQNYIEKELEDYSLPYAAYVSEIVAEIKPRFWSGEEPEGLERALKRCFKSQVANDGPNLGFKPIWSGSRCWCYHFNSFNNGKGSIILLTKHRISDIIEGENPFHSSYVNNTIFELFVKAGKPDLFREWIMSEEVKDRFVWCLEYNTTPNNLYEGFNELDKDEKSIIINKTHKKLKKRLEQMKKLYGYAYPFEETRERIIQKNVEYLEGSNFENKEKAKEIAKRLYSIEEINEDDIDEAITDLENLEKELEQVEEVEE